MKRVLLAAVLAASPFLANAAKSVDAKPFSYNELVRFERVSDPAASVDGKLIAYTLRETDYEANKAKRSLWIVPADGSAPTRRVTGSGNASDGRWGSDGALYFLSSRSGSSQVWRLSLVGGEAMQVTSLPLDVGAFVLSPTGDRIAVALEVFPELATLEDAKTRLDALDKKPSAGKLYDKLFVRHWDTWKNGSRNQLFTLTMQDGIATGSPVWITKGLDGDAPSKPFGGAEEFTFSPDGQKLYFGLREAGRTEAWSTNLDLWQVPADGSAKPVNLTADNDATDTGPAVSPDGKTLAYRAMKRPGFEADRYAVLLRDLATGKTRELAADWDRSAETLVWSADGKTLYTKADDLGQNRVFSIDVSSGKVKALTDEGTVEGFALGNKGLVVAHNNLGRPTDLYRVERTGLKALTRHNGEALATLKFGAYEQFKFKGWNDETVYGYVAKPANYEKGKKYPVAFIVHGGPQGSMGNHFHYRWNPQTYAGAGYAVVFIDFHGSTGYGQAFTDSISGDWGGKPLEDLQKGYAHALKTYDFLDSTKAAALGASYGGYMMNWIAGNWAEPFKAIVNHDGIFDNRSMGYTTEELWFDEWELGGTPYEQPAAYEKHNPINHVTKWKTPMLVIQGEKDFRVPTEQGLATFTALQRRGIPSQLLVFPDENHWVLKPQNSVQWHETVEAWLARWLK
ncbi:MAG: S9 family peptidase [Stagnimonas sp.]|nr:S9 family peptidase [Stagnimonas sp.]